MPQSITPFRIEIDSAEIDELRRRLAATRWPDRDTTGDWRPGIPLDYMQSVCDYWASGYEMQRVADRVNKFPQFRTTIDDLGIHFLHVRSTHADALPLLITHGWPGSVVEFLKVIEPLTCAESGSRPTADSAVTDLPDPDSPTTPSNSPGSR